MKLKWMFLLTSSVCRNGVYDPIKAASNQLNISCKETKHFSEYTQTGQVLDLFRMHCTRKMTLRKDGNKTHTLCWTDFLTTEKDAFQETEQLLLGLAFGMLYLFGMVINQSTFQLYVMLMVRLLI